MEMRQPLIWQDMASHQKHRLSDYTYCQNEGKSPRRNVLLLGGPRADIPAVFESLATSPSLERILRGCHSMSGYISASSQE